MGSWDVRAGIYKIAFSIINKQAPLRGFYTSKNKSISKPRKGLFYCLTAFNPIAITIVSIRAIVFFASFPLPVKAIGPAKDSGGQSIN